MGNSLKMVIIVNSNFNCHHGFKRAVFASISEFTAPKIPAWQVDEHLHSRGYDTGRSPPDPLWPAVVSAATGSDYRRGAGAKGHAGGDGR